MDIGATASTNPYTYLSVNKSSQGSVSSGSSATAVPAIGTTQNSVALQALSATLSSQPDLYDAKGALNTSAASHYLSNLTSSLSSLTSGSGAFGLFSSASYTTLTTQDGLTADAAASLFGNSAASTSSVFPASVLNLNASMALASYNYQQSLSGSTTGSAPTPTSTIQASIASAQATVFSSMFNLIG